MSEYISREAAIRVIDELYVKRPLDSDRFVLTGVGARLEELPAADVRPVVKCHRDQTGRSSEAKHFPALQRLWPSNGENNRRTNMKRLSWCCRRAERTTMNGINKILKKL